MNPQEASLDPQGRTQPSAGSSMRPQYQLAVVAFAAVIFVGCLFNTPSLMDDVDASHASISRTMLDSGDWVTARLDGVIYLEKSPFIYWASAASFAIFGVHDWAARIPIALSAVLLCWVTGLFGAWAFGEREGFYSGLALATCVGLFLFTRVLIPEVILTLTVTLGFWSFLRALDEDDARSRLWPLVLGASLGVGLLIKGLVALVATGGGVFLYLLVTRQLFSLETWRRLRPVSAFLVMVLIPAPWYVLATLHNPPYFDFSFQSGPGHFRGFFWFYFINEHVLRFLNLRYPRDYNTVPRLQFWLYHLLWLFPWSIYFPAAATLKFRPDDRAGRVRLMALCWTGFLLLFFTLSTTQEYYSMPVYPALALLLGSAMAAGGKLVRWGTRAAATLAGAGVVVILAILYHVRNMPTPGDIVSALTHNPDAYTLSLGHMQDLTLASFAYFRLPLIVAAVALLAGAVGGWMFTNGRAYLSLAIMIVIFTHAARMAMVIMDPLLSSRPLAEALVDSPPGEMIISDEYYSFASVVFYANRDGLLLNGRGNNLEYGSNAPGAPDVFIDDSRFLELWRSPNRYYILATRTSEPRLRELTGDRIFSVKESGGKFLFTNLPVNGMGVISY